MRATPGCVRLWQQDRWSIFGARSYAWAQNNCGRTIRLKFDWAYDFDGSCITYVPGYIHQEWRIGYAPYVRAANPC